MTEKIREIRFEHFRGLEDYSVALKGKNLVILGGNGKGKSAIVDGLEFLFSGQIGRFHGEGTGAIDDSETLRHILNRGEPLVEVCFAPTNACAQRRQSDAAIRVPDRPSIASYLATHPPVGAFILRRSQILGFIADRDATRYQKYIHLLGLSDIDAMQKAFVDAADRASSDRELQRRVLQLQLAAFRDPSKGSIPYSLAEVLERCSQALLALGETGINSWNELPSAIALLEAKRTTKNKARVDAFNRAIIALQRPLPTGMDRLVGELANLQSTLGSLRTASDEAAQSGVIREGSAFFDAHPGITTCPLCRQELVDGYAKTIEQLHERQSMLGLVEETERRRSSVLDQLAVDTQRSADILASDLEHEALLTAVERQSLRNARASALRLTRAVRRVRLSVVETKTPEIPRNLSASYQARSAVVEVLEQQRQALIPTDEARLENAIALLVKSRDAEPAIRRTVLEQKRTDVAAGRALRAKDAFSRAREEAIQKAFDRIAGKVLEYYQKLHNYVTGAETSECSDLAFAQTSRAAAGGLRLAIKFLGSTDLRDPRPFLSEGHLDSLGLCIYLATVRIFNRPGSLLVLDDVLTSIDEGHRYRVAELLFEQFRDFQIMLTTHDRHWFDILQSSCRARGEQGNWRFIKIARWTLERGPESAAFEGTWDYITENLNDVSFRELGGPLRVVFEDFLKRVAAKLELGVKYNFEGRYTSGDFLSAGIQDALREKLLVETPNDEALIKQDVARVFGNGDLINYLSHDNPARLDVTFQQTSDFVTGLKSLTTLCVTHKLIKGVSA